MGALITIEDRLQVEVERRWLAAPGGIPAEALDDLAGAPALRDRQRWGVVRARDLVGLLQPWTERVAIEGDRITKVGGARYVTLVGLVDEPWVRALFDDGSGRLAPWRERDDKAEGDTLTIAGSDGDLRQLLAPRTPGAIEAMLRRSSGLEPEVDWLAQPLVGVSAGDTAAWIANCFDGNNAAGLALVRRDMIAARQLLSDQAGTIDPADKLMLRRLRNWREVERLVELMRHAAATGCGCDELLVALSDPGLTAATIVTGRAPATAIGDAWMHTATLHAWLGRGDLPIAKSYPLRAYGQLHPTRGDIAVALCDADTALFHAGAMQAADLLAGTSRTIFPVGGEQPYDAMFGVELMRFAALALRAIARKSGEPSAKSHDARVKIGRLALWLTRLVSPAHFEAYADRWANTTGARLAGLTRQDLAAGLADPWFLHDVGDAQLMKSEKVRRFVPTAAASVFDPWCWNRPPLAEHWQAGRDIAAGAAHPRDDDGPAKRALLDTVAAIGTSLPGPFAARGALVAEAVRIAEMVGPHATPLATDPALLSLSMASGAAAGSKPRLPFVKLSRRKLASIAARGRLSRSQHRRSAESSANRRPKDGM